MTRLISSAAPRSVGVEALAAVTSSDAPTGNGRQISVFPQAGSVNGNSGNIQTPFGLLKLLRNLQRDLQHCDRVITGDAFWTLDANRLANGVRLGGDDDALEVAELLRDGARRLVSKRELLLPVHNRFIAPRTVSALENKIGVRRGTRKMIG